HQTDPGVFYEQQDLWEFAEIYYRQGEKPRPMDPYYLTVGLVEENDPEFLLLLPLSPTRRDNLRALALGRSDPAHRGEIVLYRFPEGEHVYGPSQIATVIDQDTDIAQQFTLWDQAGSEVARGRMIILPMDGKIVYFQPVYLRSTASSRFPELKRIIASEGTVAVMDVSVEKALEKMEARLAKRARQAEDRFSGKGEDPGPASQAPEAQPPDTVPEAPEPAQPKAVPAI
ncbi:MAG: UPF0182 family protein, partial [Deltaproteobacteria bacterium]|nr:UPF0182 family protein [Deltaproteobacteria bacterium]